MPTVEKVYNVHDNKILKIVKEGGVIINLVSTGVDRMVLRLFPKEQRGNVRGYTFDSDILGEGADEEFDWSTDGVDGVVAFMLGALGVKEGLYRTYLVIYDPSHTSGQSWPEFDIRFIDVVST